jgi:DNA-directed RNA polymerase subunit alpha
MSQTASVNERAAEEFFRRGKDAEHEGNVEKAIDYFERALGENPDNEAACFQLALLYDRRGEDSKAIELYERLCTSEPVHLNALMNLAVLYEDNNFYDQAKRCLDAVLVSNPNHERARLYLKDVMSARSMYVEDTNADAERNAALEIPITDFELSVRSRNALKKMNVRTLGDLLKVSEQELLAHKNFGETSLNEIKSLLAARGLRLGQASGEAGGGLAGLAGLSSGSTGLGGTVTASAGASALGGLLGGGGGGSGGAGLGAVAKRPLNVPGDIPEEILAKSVNDVELSVRSRKALQRLNIATVGELASRTEDELLGCKNFGTTSLNELKQILAQFGMGFRKLDA